MRILSIIIVIAISVMTVACGKKAAVIARDPSTPTVQLQEDEKYLVQFTNGQTFKVKGSDIVMRGDRVGIRFEPEGEMNFYRREQIEEVSTKVGGMSSAAIGAIAGGTAGAGLGLIVSLAGKCSGDEGSSDDCDGMRTVGLTVATPIMAAGGAGLGALIGWIVDRATKKKSPVNVAPQVYGNEGMKVTGGGLGISGRF